MSASLFHSLCFHSQHLRLRYRRHRVYRLALLVQQHHARAQGVKDILVYQDVRHVAAADARVYQHLEATLLRGPAEVEVLAPRPVKPEPLFESWLSLDGLKRLKRSPHAAKAHRIYLNRLTLLPVQNGPVFVFVALG